MSDACWTKRTYLTLTNDLGPGLQLSLHCKSGNVDLGQQYLAPGGSWSFDFCSSYWGITLYFCNMVWNGGNKWFDIYTGARDSFICGQCGWSIRPTGPCRNHHGKVDCFPWNNSTSVHKWSK
uniref:S-protein homolog n=1 Tax=Salix viminalis TaxID=40686 RepID=A0A6N2N6U2_SALVM